MDGEVISTKVLDGLNVKQREAATHADQDWWDAHPYKTFEDAVKGVQANQAALGVSNLFFWP